jgi:hypothetical protein
MKNEEEEEAASTKTKKVVHGDFIRYHSDIKEGKTIMFSSYDAVPNFLKGNVPTPQIPQKVRLIKLLTVLLLSVPTDMRHHRITR